MEPGGGQKEKEKEEGREARRPTTPSSRAEQQEGSPSGEVKPLQEGCSGGGKQGQGLTAPCCTQQEEAPPASSSYHKLPAEGIQSSSERLSRRSNIEDLRIRRTITEAPNYEVAGSDGGAKADALATKLREVLA